MDWPTFNRITLHRLQEQLHRQYATLIEMRAWLKRYGYGPGHRLTFENEYSIRATAGYLEVVQEMIIHFAPYRPLIDPYTKSGLASHLRPDFRARVTDRHDGIK